VQTWKEIVLHGNACFDQERWYDAEAYYMSAIDQLESLWLLDKENCQLMMGWVAAMHNVSSLKEKQGQSKAALKPLMQAYKTIMSLLNTASISEGFHFSVRRAALTALIPLLDFSKTHPICDCCKASLEASWQKLESSQYALH
jgi:hypothetical protein